MWTRRGRSCRPSAGTTTAASACVPSWTRSTSACTGVTDRDDIRYIYSTFPIVEREEKAAYRTYRSRDLCLAWTNALAAGDPDAEIDL